ncbi:MAG: tRNA 2-thiouridine(34) synthase MnmA [Termitinemataceae bacterium]|nr:MAG: tRNA 2-thiouridine(34) synthase MnmA [Termitinemataceae bacterium]
MTPNTKKALIAMSGGVDSSVAAHLMIQNGFDCIGVTMKLFDTNDDALQAHKEKSCCSLSDVNDARDVAYRLGIPHYVVNLSREFNQNVIDRFVAVYEAGGTPNPCIDCNRFIKFNTLLLRAHQLEYDNLVTGHYAQIEPSGSRFLLKKSADTQKDQSYVLYAMTQEQLAQTVFPLGAMHKEEVRAIAAAQKFINAHKKDSQDICFVPDGDYGTFMEKRKGKHYPEGNIIDTSGNVIGRHKGFVRYTIGQRRGLGLSFPVPMYVSAKSARDNTVTLGTDTSLLSESLIAGDLNLIALERIDKPLKVSVKTRYLQAEQPATVEQIAPDKIRIDFETPQRAITAGQAAVFYDGEFVLGGGTIDSAV